MSKPIKLILISIFLIIASSENAQETLTSLQKYLKEIPGIEIEKLQFVDPFTEKYMLMVPQAIDHKDPSKGMFTQRVYVLFRDKDAPVVLTTEGYQAGYGGFIQYKNELDNYLGANEVLVEHRYFGTSSPDSLDWQYMTVEQAANDHHRVVELLKP